LFWHWQDISRVCPPEASLIRRPALTGSGWSLWSKDIIILITEDSTAGPQAWVDAYHDMHDATSIEDLPLKAGALQGVLVLNYPAGPGGHRYDKLHIIYEGINGQQPNLDLFNTAIDIAKGQMGVDTVIQRMWNHNDGYRARLETLGRGMVCQGLGHATGPHSAFIPYHVDAITLQTIGDGLHDEMTLGRVVESTFPQPKQPPRAPPSEFLFLSLDGLLSFRQHRNVSAECHACGDKFLHHVHRSLGEKWTIDAFERSQGVLRRSQVTRAEGGGH